MTRLREKYRTEHNDIIRELCEEWGARNRVEVKIDRLVSAGNQILLTIASEAQSRSGQPSTRW